LLGLVFKHQSRAGAVPDVLEFAAADQRGNHRCHAAPLPLCRYHLVDHVVFDRTVGVAFFAVGGAGCGNRLRFSKIVRHIFSRFKDIRAKKEFLI
jgi:hypothetical protein